MFCSHCGADAGDSARFCPACGAAMEATGGDAATVPGELGGQGEPLPPTSFPTAASGTPPAARRRWLGRPLVLGAVVALGLVAAVAIVVSFVLGDAPPDRAIDLVPADATFYATLHLDPSLGQKRAAQNVLDRAVEAGAGDSTTSLDDAIATLMDPTPVDYERDVKPYGGRQLAIYVLPGGDPTLLIGTDNPGDSRRGMHRLLRTEYAGYYYRIMRGAHRGHPYEHVVYNEGGGSPSGPVAFAIVDGFVVIGGEREVVKSIDASYGDPSLASLDRFADARSGLSDDVLAFAYFDGEPLAQAAREDEYASSEETAPLEAIADAGPLAATLTARNSGLELDLLTRGSTGGVALARNPSALLETLPAEAIGAVSFGNVGASLRGRQGGGIGEGVKMLRDSVAELAELDLDSDIAPWLGQVGLYVAGENPDTVETALVAETRSPRDSDRVLDRIESYYSSGDYGYGFDSYVYGSDDGLGFDVVDGESVMEVRGDDDRVVAGSGEAGFATDRALDADGGFDESDAYRRAVGLLGGYQPFLVIDAPPMRRLLEQLTDAQYDDTYMNDVRQWLASVDTVAAGVRSNGDEMSIRLAVGVGGA